MAFSGRNSKSLLLSNMQGIIKYNEKIWEEISQEAKDLMKSMLAPKPEDRPSAHQALTSKWFQMKLKSDSDATLKKGPSFQKPCLERDGLDSILLRRESSLFVSFDSYDSYDSQEVEINQSPMKNVNKINGYFLKF